MACRLLAKPAIQEKIQLLRQKYAREHIADENPLIDNLINIATHPGINPETWTEEATDEFGNSVTVWKSPEQLDDADRAVLKRTVPVRGLEGWSSYELESQVAAISKLLDILNSELHELQRDVIAKALLNMGELQGFSEDDMAVLRGAIGIDTVRPVITDNLSEAS